MADDDQKVEFKIEPELPWWGKVLLGVLIVWLVLIGFVWDKRAVGERGGYLETMAVVLDVALGVAGLVALFNLKKIFDAVVERFLTLLEERGLVVAVAAPLKKRVNERETADTASADVTN